MADPPAHAAPRGSSWSLSAWASAGAISPSPTACHASSRQRDAVVRVTVTLRSTAAQAGCVRSGASVALRRASMRAIAAAVLAARRTRRCRGVAALRRVRARRGRLGAVHVCGRAAGRVVRSWGWPVVAGGPAADGSCRRRASVSCHWCLASDVVGHVPATPRRRDIARRARAHEGCRVRRLVAVAAVMWRPLGARPCSVRPRVAAVGGGQPRRPLIRRSAPARPTCATACAASAR